MDDTRQAKRNTLSCYRDGCDFTTPRPDHMELHELRHQGIRPYSCYLDGCPYKAYTASALKIHEMTHRGEQPHVCDICRRAFTQSGTRDRHRRLKHPDQPPKVRPLLKGEMARHKKTHERAKKIRPFLFCDDDGCDFKSRRPSEMARHKKTHERAKKIRPLLSCDVEGCPYTTRRPDYMDLHEKRHRGEKTFSCDTCPYRAFTIYDLTVHQRTHLDEKPFVCDFEGCEYSCSQSGSLVRHKKTHTIEGQIRRKQQENRLNKLLKEWGYTVDCETTINAKAGQCLTDTERHFSRLDFRIVECVNAVCVVECDEDQHFWYNLSCEMSRMADVRASLALAGYTLPIYWIRYAPTGKYCVGGKQVSMPRKQREEGLKEHLTRVCSPDFTPENQESIHYMFYDLQSTEDGAEILLDSDFPDAMKAVVSWHR